MLRCEKPILVQDVKDNLYVCPRCGGYFRMHAYRRIEMLIDEGTFEEWDKEMSVVNPLAFPGYEGKVEAAREKTDLNEAVVTGKGKIHGYETVIAVCDSRFLMSSMGHNMGEKIARAVERATEERLPVIIYAASGGARMQEGMISLMLDDTRTRKSNQRSRLCQDDIAQGRKACRYAAGGRIRHKAYVEKSRLGMTF